MHDYFRCMAWTSMQPCLESVQYVSRPHIIPIQCEVFSEVLSESTWESVLTEADRVRLEALLPQTKGDTPQPDTDMLKYTYIS